MPAGLPVTSGCSCPGLPWPKAERAERASLGSVNSSHSSGEGWRMDAVAWSC